MKRIEREKVIRNAYRSIILALTACCIFLGVVLVVHELAREYEVEKLNQKIRQPAHPSFRMKAMREIRC